MLGAVARVGVKGNSGSLQFEEPFLQADSTGKAHQPSARTHDPVTGDQDGNRVGSVGGTHSPGALWIPQFPGEFPVGDGRSERNPGHALPHSDLEMSSPQVRFDSELRTVTPKVLGQLPGTLGKN
jgi:hypothetical protein